MLLSPINVTENRNKKAWDNLTIYADGAFYAFFGTGVVGESVTSGPGFVDGVSGLDVFKSTDGVNYIRIAEMTAPIKGAACGFGIKKIGDYFYYYPTCTDPERGTHFRIYRSKDFLDWEYRGDVHRDERYYAIRWDEIYILDDVDEAGMAVYYGYISSETRKEIGEPGCAMLKSYDGENWDVLPPVTVDWGEVPSQHMELNFVERINGKYYLSMSGRMYMDSYGYSNYTFAGDTPFGPFTPCTQMFRLTGTSRRNVSWLGHAIPSPYGLLLALWLSHDNNPEIPSKSFFIGLLKRVIEEGGSLRLGYWEQNEILKADRIEPTFTHAYPLEIARNEKDSVEISKDRIEIRSSRDGVIILTDPIYSKESGIIVEGELIASESRQALATHHQACGVGFYFEQEPGKGIAMIADTLGVTRSGELRYSGERITDFDIYENTGQLVQARCGLLRGTLQFNFDDTVGPFGHAAYCGIRHQKKHSFRLFARGDYFELYIDDLYVQTYILPEQITGKFGLCVFDGSCLFEGIRRYEFKRNVFR